MKTFSQMFQTMLAKGTTTTWQGGGTAYAGWDPRQVELTGYAGWDPRRAELTGYAGWDPR